MTTTTTANPIGVNVTGNVNTSAGHKTAKVASAKFITTNTTRGDTVADASTDHDYLAATYEAQAKNLHYNLPKGTKHISASISYCAHTNTKVAIGTAFTNCPELTSLIKAEHPLFSRVVPLATTIRIYTKARTPTERYIAMTAIMYKIGMIDTSSCGLHLDTPCVDNLKASFDELVAVVNQALRFNCTIEVKGMLVTPETSNSHHRLKTHIKENTQIIDSAAYSAGGKRLAAVDTKASKQLVLDEEVELERELNKILNNYSKSGGKIYTKELNTWTRRTLGRSELTSEQVEMTMRILNSKPADLRTGTIEVILPIVKHNLNSDDNISRRNTAIVLRHLDYMIEIQTACLFNIVDSVKPEESVADLTRTEYVKSVKLEQDKIVAKIGKPASSRLEAMKARMGK